MPYHFPLEFDFSLREYFQEVCLELFCVDLVIRCLPRVVTSDNRIVRLSISPALHRLCTPRFSMHRHEQALVSPWDALRTGIARVIAGQHLPILGPELARLSRLSVYERHRAGELRSGRKPVRIDARRLFRCVWAFNASDFISPRVPAWGLQLDCAVLVSDQAI